MSIGDARTRWPKPSCLVGLFCVFLVLGSARVLADSPDTSQWKCELCPFNDRNHFETTSGVAYVSEGAPRYANGRGYDDAGTYFDVGATGDGRLGNTRYRFDAIDLGLDSRAVLFGLSDDGNASLDLSYRELPYRGYDTTRTIFAEQQGNSLTLPPGWQPATTTSGFVIQPNQLRSQPLELDRSISQISAQWRARESLITRIKYRRQVVNGHDSIGGSYFSQASQLIRPVDQHTDDFEIGVEYLMDWVSFDLTLFGSYFDNNLSTLSWESPFTTPSGAESAALAETPDNRFHQWKFSGTARLPARSRISFSYSSGAGRQDEVLAPYTQNPNLTQALPRATADAAVDTSYLNIQLTSQLRDNIRGRVTFRDNERDNTTTISNWDRVIAESFASGDTTPNPRYGYRQRRVQADISWRARPRLRLGSGIALTRLDRDQQEVPKSSEYDSWASLKWQSSSAFSLSVKGGAAKREPDSYDLQLAESLGQNPLHRRSYLAYRYGQYADLQATLTPADLPLSFTANAHAADNSYSQTQLGLGDNRDYAFGLGAGWSPSARVNTWFDAQWQQVKFTQNGSAAFDTPDWQAKTEDKFLYLATGVAVRDIGDRVDLRGTLGWSAGDTAISTSETGRSDESFPDLRSRRFELELEADYRLRDSLSAFVALAYQDFDTDDWALDGVNEVTVPTVLGLGARSFDHSVYVVTVGFRWQLSGDP